MMATGVSERINNHLKELRLPTIKECFTDCANSARSESFTFEEYLLELVERECEDRTARRIERYLRESRLPHEKSFHTFDMKRLPVKVRAQVDHLLDGTFLDRHDNVLVFGNIGSGKSHLVSAVCQELVYRQQRRPYFTPSSLLIQDLLVAKRALKLKNRLRYYDRYDMICIDDIGYVQHDRDEMEILFSLLAHRYERASVMITSNLPFSKWEQIFKDPMTAAAAVDRLIHHSVIIELNLPSYRLEHSSGQKAEEQK